MGMAVSGQSDWERKLPKSKPKPKKPEGITFGGYMGEAVTTVEDVETALGQVNNDTSVCNQQVSIWSTEASFQADKLTFACSSGTPEK